jgi:2-polyprenyl-3-methyl-5-hydroxy-6-metoxy-1,4-benzoquinol methylase
MNACAVVQCTHSDLLDSRFRPGAAEADDAADPDLYATGPLAADARLPVVLAAPDVPENRQLIPLLADAWGVHAHLGPEHDVLARVAGAARAAGADTVARVVLPAFYVDPPLVHRQLATLDAEAADYCTLPRDFNLSFGADVCTVAALERLHARAGALARYRPWPFLERDGFRATVCDAVPDVSPQRLDAIRRHPTWPERAGPGIQGGEYDALAAELLRPGDTVLDAGCGHGEIAARLRRHCARVVGLDRDAAAAALARERFPDVEFHHGDAASWTTRERFDVIVHLHTLEHLPDAVAALRHLRRLLKPHGRLVVEVPLLLRPGIVNPHHEREYTVARLREELAAAGLAIVTERGVARGIYGPPETAREAYMAITEAA